MNQIEQLGAIEDIKQLKARYFRLMDTKDWVNFERLFCTDAILDMRKALGSTEDENGLVAGAKNIVIFVRNAVDKLITVHQGHMPEIELISLHSARGVWPMEDVLVWPDGSSVPIKSLHGYGHYHETYECIDAVWYIKSSALTRLRVDIIPAADSGQVQ